MLGSIRSPYSSIGGAESVFREIRKEWRREGVGRRVGTVKNPGPPVELGVLCLLSWPSGFEKRNSP